MNLEERVKRLEKIVFRKDKNKGKKKDKKPKKRDLGVDGDDGFNLENETGDQGNDDIEQVFEIDPPEPIETVKMEMVHNTNIIENLLDILHLSWENNQLWYNGRPVDSYLHATLRDLYRMLQPKIKGEIKGFEELGIELNQGIVMLQTILEEKRKQDALDITFPLYQPNPLPLEPPPPYIY